MLGTTYGSDMTFTPLAIGISYQGGIVAYILQSGDLGYDANVPHGLIASTSDLGLYPWYNGTYTTVGTTSQNLGTGMANTIAIIASQGPGNYAAYICRSYTGGGYTDWYLPSYNELVKFLLQYSVINIPSGQLYWSSSEVTNSTADMVRFNNGTNFLYNMTKSNGFSVRAVRSF